MTSTMLPRMATDRFATGLAIAATLIATLCISTATTTQAQQSAQPRCPAGYWLLEPVCLNQTTGDVVNAGPQEPGVLAQLQRAVEDASGRCSGACAVHSQFSFRNQGRRRICQTTEAGLRPAHSILAAAARAAAIEVWALLVVAVGKRI